MNWLFLRGLAREQRHWGAFPRTFERIVSGARVHCLDLPGAGTERERTSPTTIEGVAADVRGRWLSLREEHPGAWSVLGISLGGMVAMAWSAAHPSDFARVVLAATSASDLSPPWRRFDLRIVPTALGALTQRDAARREEKILSMTSRLNRRPAEVAASWSQFLPMRRANVARQLLAASAFRAPARLPTPVLVVVGACDPLADPSCSRLLAERFGAPIAVHPGAGHELALDAPEWFAGEIAAWMDATGGAPAGAAAARG